MNRKIQHTPEGVRDIIRNECEEKHALESKLRTVMNTFGYRDIETPTFEYFDVFGSQIGTIPSNELYKFFDREGNTLVLRPDFTPSIARAASRYFTEEKEPVRLCYLGNTFVNHSSYRGRLKETTQLGAELIADDSAQADAEMLAMAASIMKEAGLEEFMISLGDVRFFESLVEESGMDENTEEELKELIRNKNIFGVEKLLADMDFDESLKNVFVSLPSLLGGTEVIDQARNMIKDGVAGKAIAALDRLEEICRILEMYGMKQYISIELGMMSAYMYYTGIIFRAYTYGTGESVIKGGRYDKLLRFFGTDVPAIGFVVVMENVMNAIRRQKLSMPQLRKRVLILYKEQQMADAIAKAQELRRQGIAAELRMITAEAEYANKSADAQGADHETAADCACHAGYEIIRMGEEA